MFKPQHSEIQMRAENVCHRPGKELRARIDGHLLAHTPYRDSAQLSHKGIITHNLQREIALIRAQELA